MAGKVEAREQGLGVTVCMPVGTCLQHVNGLRHHVCGHERRHAPSVRRQVCQRPNRALARVGAALGLHTLGHNSAWHLLQASIMQRIPCAASSTRNATRHPRSRTSPFQSRAAGLAGAPPPLPTGGMPFLSASHCRGKHTQNAGNTSDQCLAGSTGPQAWGLQHDAATPWVDDLLLSAARLKDSKQEAHCHKAGRGVEVQHLLPTGWLHAQVAHEPGSCLNSSRLRVAQHPAKWRHCVRHSDPGPGSARSPQSNVNATHTPEPMALPVNPAFVTHTPRAKQSP
jgi:hypothetical protein